MACDDQDQLFVSRHAERVSIITLGGCHAATQDDEVGGDRGH
jgi:hypothetical protein